MRLRPIAMAISALISVTSAQSDPLDDAVRDYDQCFMERLSTLVTSCEESSAVAVAIVAGCSQLLSNVTTGYTKAGGKFSDGKQFATDLEASRERQAMARIVEARTIQSCK